MAMAFDERREAAGEQRPVNERVTNQRVTPAHSRAATAHKLEEVAMSEFEIAETQPEETANKPRRRNIQSTATRTKVVPPEIGQGQQEQVKLVEDLEARRDELVERLDTGAARIEEAREKGRDVHEWEDYWIHLLRQYEQTCDKLRELSKAY